MEKTKFTLLDVHCSTSSRMGMCDATEISNWTLKVISLCMIACSVYIGHHTNFLLKGMLFCSFPENKITNSTQSLCHLRT